MREALFPVLQEDSLNAPFSSATRTQLMEEVAFDTVASNDLGSDKRNHVPAFGQFAANG